MKIKILNYYEDRIPKELRSLVKNKFKKKIFAFKSTTYKEKISKQIKLVKWADVLLLTPGRYLDSKVLNNAKHIKLIQIWSSGFDKLNLLSIKQNKIPLANNGSVNATAVSEHTVLLILSVLKKIISYNKITTSGKWHGNSHGMDCCNLKNKKVGIIGYGRIGKKVAGLCKGFGAKIFYNDIKKVSEKNKNLKYLSLKKIMNECDIITIHLHYNKKTHNIIDKEHLKLMKKNSIFINVSRAGLVDNKYLNFLLKNKKIFGAGIDVFDKEPTQKGDIFLNLNNVVLTPHTAGSTLDTYEEVVNNCYENIVNVLKKKKIKWLINF